MFVNRVESSPRHERGNGQASHLLLARGEFGARNLAVTWVECAPGSQQDLHAHAESEQVYVIVKGRGQMIVSSEEREVEAGTLVFVAPGELHAIRNGTPDLLVYVSASSPPFPVDRPDAATWIPAG